MRFFGKDAIHSRVVVQFGVVIEEKNDELGVFFRTVIVSIHAFLNPMNYRVQQKFVLNILVKRPIVGLSKMKSHLKLF